MARLGVRVTALLAALAIGAAGTISEAASRLPYTFFLTHYELLGDPNNPTGVRYHSNGQPFATSLAGSTIAVSGNGAWNPRTGTAEGGGRYVVKNSSGAPVAEGAWRVTGFVSFQQFEGWWEPGFKEVGWQGPLGSVSFSGFLTLRVRLEKLGEGLVMTWCLMPTVRMPGDHKSDGVMVVGPGFSFVDYRPTEQSMEGVMFYSTDPRSRGYALNPGGTAFLTSPWR